MKKQVLFIHGGDDDGYGADAKLAASLEKELGKDYEINYPRMPDDDTPDFGWPKQIGKEIDKLRDDVILVAHSLGASMLLKYLSENKVSKKIAGVFLIATPLWSGNEEWKQGLKLHKDFADKIPKGVPVFLYHSKDDDMAPFHHLEFYTQNLPQATARIITSGGHQLNNDLSLVARDIKSL